MIKVHSNKLSDMGDFNEVSSVHSYPTRAASSEKYYVQRTILAKTQQSVKTSGVNIWNNLPESIKQRATPDSNIKFS